jgi:phage protein D
MTINPNYAVKVGTYELDEGVRQLIDTITYESADGLIDVAHIKCKDPYFELSNSQILAPGNEVSIWMGYGEQLNHVGRVKIYKNTPNFPQNDMPTFEAVGYTKDKDLMVKQPDVSSSDLSKFSGDAQRGGHTFKDMEYWEAVQEKAKDHKFSVDIDKTPGEPSNFIQKAGMSDYDFIRGLANLSGFYFWVDGDENGKWTLHFKDPENFDSEQDQILNFTYNDGDFSTLFTFKPELLINSSIARIRARIKDPITGDVLEAEFEEKNDESPDPLFISDVESSKLDSSPDTSAAIEIFIGEYSFEEITGRRFQSEADLINWVKQWYRRQRENFILSQGTAIGVETVMCRQIHNISGIGPVYDGEYFFNRVKHTMDPNGAGYKMDFNCRKQVPPVE